MRFPDNARVCFVGDSLTAANQVLPKIEAESWGIPAFEPFIRGFDAIGFGKVEQYKQIDRVYEKDVFNHYGK